MIVNGEGTWQSADGNEWRGEAPRTGPLAGGNGTGTLQLGRARGIAVSVVIKPAMVLDGRVEWPAIETFTWCANFQFV